MNIHSTQLLAALKTVKPAVSQRPVIPILSCIKIEGNKLTATNLNITVTAILEDYDEQPITLPYAETLSICNTVNSPLTITPEQIKSDKSKFSIGEPFDVGTFPKTEAVKGLEVTIPENVVVSLKKAATMTSKDTYRSIDHVFIHRSANKLMVKASDAHSAFMESFDLPGSDFEALLPVDIINALETDECTATISDTLIEFSTESMSVSGKLAEGKFPDIEMFFRLEGKQFAATFKKSELIEALNTVMVYSILPLCNFDFDGSEAMLTIKDHDVKKDATTSLPATFSPETPSFLLNASLVKKLLSFLPEKQESVTLHLSTPTKPVQINAENKDLQLIIMPMADVKKV